MECAAKPLQHHAKSKFLHLTTIFSAGLVLIALALNRWLAGGYFPAGMVLNLESRKGSSPLLTFGGGNDPARPPYASHDDHLDSGRGCFSPCIEINPLRKREKGRYYFRCMRRV